MKLRMILIFSLLWQLNLNLNAEQLDDVTNKSDLKNLTLSIDKLGCDFKAKVLSSCLDDFAEIKSYKINLKEHLVDIKLSADARLLDILNCLKYEGLAAKIRVIK